MHDVTFDTIDSLTRVCAMLEAGDSAGAGAVARVDYPFQPLELIQRKYGVSDLVSLLFRDGFVDRYTGGRLVLPAALRMLSIALPNEFPYHPNWKMSETHPAYWQLSPTIDHVVPVSSGGADEPSNWVCTSMLTNSRKANWSLDALGWDLLPPGDWRKWDGLSQWFLRYAKLHPEMLTPALRGWVRTVEDVLSREST